MDEHVTPHRPAQSAPTRAGPAPAPAWVIMQRVMIVTGDRAEIHGRGPLVLIVVCTTLAVAVFCAIVAFAFNH